MNSLLGHFVETAWNIHVLAGTGELNRLEVRDAAIDILTDMTWEVGR